jgi:HAD superfamily hydrolase (TIGR01509 family)
VSVSDPIAAAVFDCDGLLVDSAACWRLAYERALARRGRALDEELLARLSGASVASAARLLELEAELLRAELARAFRDEPLPALPGAALLLEALAGRLPVAVATNAPAELATLALQRAGLGEVLPPIVSADGGRQKPEPDVYLAACGRLGAAPGQAVAFEDSPVGAAAALAAGVRLVYVPSGVGGDVPGAELEAGRLDEGCVLELLGVGLELTNTNRSR